LIAADTGRRPDRGIAATQGQPRQHRLSDAGNHAGIDVDDLEFLFGDTAERQAA